MGEGMSGRAKRPHRGLEPAINQNRAPAQSAHPSPFFGALSQDLFDIIAKRLPARDLAHVSLASSCAAEKALGCHSFSRARGVALERRIGLLDDAMEAHSLVLREGKSIGLISKVEIPESIGAQAVIWPCLLRATNLRHLVVRREPVFPDDSVAEGMTSAWPKLQHVTMSIEDEAMTPHRVLGLLRRLPKSLVSLSLLAFSESRYGWIQWQPFYQQMSALMGGFTQLDTLEIRMPYSQDDAFDASLALSFLNAVPTTLTRLRLQVEHDMLPYSAFFAGLTRLHLLQTLEFIGERIHDDSTLLVTLVAAVPPMLSRLVLSCDMLTALDADGLDALKIARARCHRLETLVIEQTLPFPVHLDESWHDSGPALDSLSIMSGTGGDGIRHLEVGFHLDSARIRAVGLRHLVLPDSLHSCILTWKVGEAVEAAALATSLRRFCRRLPPTLGRLHIRMGTGNGQQASDAELVSSLARACRDGLRAEQCVVDVTS